MAERLGQQTSPEVDRRTPLQRFDALVKGLMPLAQKPVRINGYNLDMGNRIMPTLTVGDEKFRFSFFKPNRKRGPAYRQEILFQSLALKYTGEIAYPAPVREVHIERDSIHEVDLAHFEDALLLYREVAEQLSPIDARGMGFSEHFIRAREEAALASLSLEQTVQIVEN